MVRRPQLCEAPAATWEKAPVGGDARPFVSSPQQETVPSSRIPQACEPPVATLEKEPSGAVACPAQFCSQHVTLLSTRTAHVWCTPALTLTLALAAPGAREPAVSGSAASVPVAVTKAIHADTNARSRLERCGVFYPALDLSDVDAGTVVPTHGDGTNVRRDVNCSG